MLKPLLKKRIEQLNTQQRWTFASAILLIFVGVFIHWRAGVSPRTAAPQSSTEPSGESTLSTFIPHGYSLVPIEVLNSQGLDSILGRYGHVDLYLESTKELFLSQVRLIRSLDDEPSWAALVTHDGAQKIMSQGQRFYIALKGQNESASQNNKKNIKRRIIYEN